MGMMRVGGLLKYPASPPPTHGVPTAALRDNFRLQPGDLVATAGQALELDCVPPLGHPEPRVTWKKDGVTLDLAGDRYVVTNGKLRVAPARRSDSGLYICVAANAAGERESRGARVSVLGKPRVSHGWWTRHAQPWCHVLDVPPRREANHRAAPKRRCSGGRQHRGAGLRRPR